MRACRGHGTCTCQCALTSMLRCLALVLSIYRSTVMFQTFDHSMAQLALARSRGMLPSWFCSSTLSTGSLAVPNAHSSSTCPPSAHSSHPAFLAPHIGPDVFLSGCLSGAAQTTLVTPMENSATWMRLKYRLMEQAAVAKAAAGATATAATAAHSAGHGVSACCRPLRRSTCTRVSTSPAPFAR
jgi:hypothetical protein